MNDEAETIEHTVRRHVGIAALRKLHGMVDAEQQAEADKARWVRRLSLLLGLVAAIGLFCIAVTALR